MRASDFSLFYGMWMTSKAYRCPVLWCCATVIFRASYFAMDRTLDDQVHFLLNWHIQGMLLVRCKRPVRGLRIYETWSDGLCSRVGCKYSLRMGSSLLSNFVIDSACLEVANLITNSSPSSSADCLSKLASFAYPYPQLIRVIILQDWSSCSPVLPTPPYFPQCCSTWGLKHCSTKGPNNLPTNVWLVHSK